MRETVGAAAPFFLRQCIPRLRDDALLSHAMQAHAAGDEAGALLAAEYVCRRHPRQGAPAILRAVILQACHHALGLKAWYRAWCADPENPLLQDTLLRHWLEAGAGASVDELGPAFLPRRCRDGSHASLYALLGTRGAAPPGACWRDGGAIEVWLAAAAEPVVLLVCGEDIEQRYHLPAAGGRFRLAPPRPDGVWSLAVAAPTPRLLPGSPLVLGMANADQAGATVAPVAAPAAAPIFAPTMAPVATPVDTPVVIIVPVYRDLALVRACLDSVLASLPLNRVPASLLVIDDASPEAALSAWLDAQAAAGRLRLLRNRHNLGFIETVNRALRACAGADPLLLNADTLVQGDWIDRLRAALYSADDLAAVTPWSNNGEISSFPVAAAAATAPTPTELRELDECAAALRRSGRTTDIELPSCCGFAMLMRRRVIDRIGMLDGAALQRGYGEEVDWCLRARAAGYRHLAATGVFVAHAGTASFRFEKQLRVRQNRAVVHARHPGYYAEYQRFLRDDPLAGARAQLRTALASSSWLAGAERSHNGGGDNAGLLPAALPGPCVRIAVWPHRADAPWAAQVLALARLVAARGATVPTLRLLVIGDLPEALWHTGVVDGLPLGRGQEKTMLSNSELMGLGGCAILLDGGVRAAPLGIERVRLDAGFDARTWLPTWLATWRATPAAHRQQHAGRSAPPSKVITA